MVGNRLQFNGGVYVGSLDSADRTQLFDRVSHAEFAGGHLHYLRDGALVAQPLDLTRMQLTGDPEVVAEQVNVLVPQAPIGAFSVSETGHIAFETPSPDGSQLKWVDRQGRIVGTVGGPGNTGNKVQLSPDGRQALIARSMQARAPGLVVFDLVQNLERRLTADPGALPLWSPDGTQIAYAKRAGGPASIYVRPSSGAGSEESLFADKENAFPEAWSPNGRFLMIHRRDDLWVLPLFGDRKPYQFVATPTTEWDAQFSPDGKWVAYTWFTAGRFEIYVSPFSDSATTPAADKWLVSAGAGHAARWHRNGKELFYWSPDTKQMMAVPVATDGPRFTVGRAVALFNARPQLESYPFTFYDVSADGQKFLISGFTQPSGRSSLSLIVNWPALLND